MIDYSKHVLDNGLRVIIHEDKSTPMGVVNVVYDVGSKDENPELTGLAHLFEHLMFSGSKHVPDFDVPIQLAGGENNAFTNNDMTCYYDVLPVENIETALWLESDRMSDLTISNAAFEVQKKVVIEEFKETSLNEPYGDMMHHLLGLSYTVHPYSWPTIGKTVEHIEKVQLEDAIAFYRKHYGPQNAVLVVAGNVKKEEILEKVNQWFGEIPAGTSYQRNLPREPKQVAYRNKSVTENGPIPAIYRAYNMVERCHPDYYAYDLLSDALGNGRSSRLYQNLHKKKELFRTIDAYISGSFDPGQFVFEGQLMPGVSLDQARQAIKEEQEYMKEQLMPREELEKIKNKVESGLEYAEVNILHKAQSLAYYELLGDAELINEEIRSYQKVTTEDIRRVARAAFREENCCEVVYDV